MAVPITPNKRARSCFEMYNVNTTPSKAPKLMYPIIKFKREALRLHTSNAQLFTDDSKEAIDSIDKSSDFDESSFPMGNESDCFSCSDLESISPMSDILSIPSSSPDIEKLAYLDPFSIDPCTNRSILSKETLELNRMICSSLVSSPNETESERSRLEIINNNSKRLKYEPCHYSRAPGKPILKIHPGSLNLLVSSSRGCLEDATLFATEINASIASGNAKNIPTVTNVWEKVTIPVNSAIKEKHRRLQKELLGDDFEIEVDSHEVATADAALIKGFKFELENERADEEIKELKTVRWVHCLVL